MDNKEDKQSEDVETVEGNIIDVEPEVETTASQPRENIEKSEKNKFQLPLILAIVAIIAVTASWIAGYRYWKNILDDLNLMQNRISQAYEQQQNLNSEILQAKNSLQEQKQKLQQQADKTQQQTQQMTADKEQMVRQAEVMQKAVDQVKQQIGQSSNQWQLAEADYLMRIANHRLSLAQDTSTALTALQQADEKLRDSGDLGLLPVREKIAEEISQLKAIKRTDITGTAAKLQSLSQQVSSLKVAGEALTVSRKNQQEDEDKPMGRSLDTLLADSWKGFRELMVIRKHDQPVSAMMPPTQQYFLYQNLQLQLESARLALLRQEGILYNSSLDTAIDWLSSFFEASDSTTQSMLATLNELKQVDIKPALPNISGSLMMLTQYRENNP